MTDTLHRLPSNGSQIRNGRSLVANTGTIATGLSLVSGFVATCESADTVVAATGITNQTVTVSLKAAGADATGTHYVNWEAWDNKKV